MSGVLVDSSVLIDISTDDAVWADRSQGAVAEAARTQELVVNPVIFAEVAIAYQRIEEIDALLPRRVFRREQLPWEAAFLAGKAFVSYRRQGGVRTSPLPEFFIGAHAAVRGYALLTRDPGSIRTYFPTVTLLSPVGSHP